MNEQDTRRERFLALCIEWHIEVKQTEHYATTSDEDAAPYLHDGEHIDRFVAVTRGDGDSGPVYYLYPCIDKTAAERRATENVLDDIFPEYPVAIYDLDEAKRWDARSVSVTWNGPKAVDAP